MELLISFIRNFVIFSYLVVAVFILVRSLEKPSLIDPYKFAFIALASFAFAVISVSEPVLCGFAK